MLEKELYIEIDRPNYTPIYSVQYDYNSRFYNVTILNQSQPLDLTGLRVVVAGKKPDGKDIFNSCKILDAEKGQIQLELTEQMNAVKGVSEYALELFSDNGMLSSQPFQLKVTKSTISKDVTSSSELSALTNALSEVKNIDNRFSETNAQLAEIKEHCTGGNGMQNHSHVNKTVLDKISEIDGDICFNGNKISSEIENGIITPEKTAYYKSYKLNILNVNDVAALPNQDYQWNGVLFSSPGGTVYDVEVEEGKTYFFDKSVFNPSSYYGVFMEENKTYLGTTNIGMHGNGKSFKVPEKAKYIRVRVNNDKKDNAYISELEGVTYKPYGTVANEIAADFEMIFKEMYEKLLSDSFVTMDKLKTENAALLDKIGLIENKLKTNSAFDDIYIMAGNRYEQHQVNFKKGFIYKLKSQADWCNINEACVDTIQSNKSLNLKGVFLVECYKNGERCLPDCDFINTASVYPVLNYNKNKQDVFFIGDSLTDPSFSSFSYNYVSRLFEKYKSFYNFVPNVANFGDTTAQQLSNVKRHCSAMEGYFSDFYSFNNVKYVSIYLGTNDIGRDTPVEVFSENYTELVEYVQEKMPKAKILLITPSLCYKKSTNVEYIKKIKEIATTKGVDIVDLSEFSELDSVTNGKNEYYMEDECIHFSEIGWELINPKIIEAFEGMGISY